MIKTAAEQEGMRAAGAELQRVLDAVQALPWRGIRTREIDDAIRDLIFEGGGIPAFLGQYGFPYHACISVNDAVVHGLPTEYKLRDGDVVGVDFGVILDGWYSDSAFTVVVGGVDRAPADVQRLIEGTKAALRAGVAACRPGTNVGMVGKAIEDVCRENRLSVVKGLCGHGIGKALHEDPPFPNHWWPTDFVLRPGMTLCLEPMTSLGSDQIVKDPDEWTLRTEDGSLSAHFEQMLLVTDGEPEILTRTV